MMAVITRPPGFPIEELLVVSENDLDNGTPLVLGVFSSLEKLIVGVAALLIERSFSFSVSHELEDDRLMTFDPDDHKIELHALPEVDELEDDLDRKATSAVFIATREGINQDTGLFVWDSAKKWALYAPLKLYWCTTPGGNEAWFSIAHTATQAARHHADEGSYQDVAASAEFIVTLPDGLQQRGDNLIGRPDHDALRACGGAFRREETPRIVELLNRMFAEGMLEHKNLPVR